MSEVVRVAIFGASGRMGGVIAEAVHETEGMNLVAAITAHPDRHAVPVAGMALVSRLDAASRPDAIVDVTAPAATASIAEQAAELDAALVVGATDLSAADEEALAHAAARVPVVVAPNLSLGVHLLRRLVRLAAERFPADIELVETHHRGKRDAPSGTARMLVEDLTRIVDAREIVHGREGARGARRREEIGVHALRGGDVAGEHTVAFLGDGERIEITHRASSRRAFALGAVRAVRFAARAAPGRYGMDDVLEG